MMAQKTPLEKDLIFLILQFLDENKLSKTARMLEQELSVFFNLRYFEELVLSGKWEEAEGYLLRFTKLKDNLFSMNMFCNMREQKYYEALDNFDHPKALDILMKELKEFFPLGNDVFKELTLLLSLNNIREDEHLSAYKDAKSARTGLMTELKKLIAANCLLPDKLQFPSIPPSRLLHLIDQRFWLILSRQELEASMMAQKTPLEKDLIFLILQFLDEKKLSKTARMLEQESSVFFNLRYFEELVLSGKWEEAEGYLLRFTKLKDNLFSSKIFCYMRQQKYYEALDNFDRAKALAILTKELKEFSALDNDVFKGFTLLLSLNNIRECERLSTYKDTKSARKSLMTLLKKLIAENCLLCDKLQFPSIPASSLDWQHKCCSNPEPLPITRTHYVDHNCQQSDDQCSQQVTSNELIGSKLAAEGCLPFGTNLSSQCVSAPIQTPCTMVDHPPHREKVFVSALEKRDAILSGFRDRIPVKKLRRSSNKIGHDVDVRNVRFKSTEEVKRKSNIWKLTEIYEPAQLQSLRLPFSMKTDKILRLIYNSSGSAILALPSNAINLLWKWPQKDRSLKVKTKATTKVSPQLKQGNSGTFTINDLNDAKPEEAMPCLALSDMILMFYQHLGGKSPCSMR